MVKIRGERTEVMVAMVDLQKVEKSSRTAPPPFPLKREKERKLSFVKFGFDELFNIGLGL
ncbi:hypothetical protein SLEP1_g22950 [Rubroshorea leprosula]|uniref:Uncharacterized protein n=1 Tax=Rubroshorea leprosula TaxID=152421 RepID=A0AAV5JMV2_9ROSI|nr:hypothetical protein SLEP1_g22950 [Rubroshorea leprosula]